MDSFLPEHVRAGLEAARKKDQRRRSRMRVEADGRSFRILRFQEDGFTLDIEDAPHLRGLVDLYDGPRHLSQCLIVASGEEVGEMRYEFKWSTRAGDRPALDFERPDDAPDGYLPDLR
ncbi:hypothetical protein SAMN04490248_12319 [Salinihabitans flavidus]|uniref:PilZ domain-containing protein n=1 Tax=Salinihabitans flavidus TaxID=569882 RepID=A0A1H8UXC1_9RHOB|nr:hypothetical protein [Salinihabitans flavidus]SEP07809.1 hypothetical protein SAMN04490248_12319 [Salinihabitans flavidus]